MTRKPPILCEVCGKQPAIMIERQPDGLAVCAECGSKRARERRQERQPGKGAF